MRTNKILRWTHTHARELCTLHPLSHISTNTRYSRQENAPPPPPPPGPPVSAKTQGPHFASGATPPHPWCDDPHPPRTRVTRQAPPAPLPSAMWRGEKDRLDTLANACTVSACLGGISSVAPFAVGLAALPYEEVVLYHPQALALCALGAASAACGVASGRLRRKTLARLHMVLSFWTLCTSLELILAAAGRAQTAGESCSLSHANYATSPRDCPALAVSWWALVGVSVAHYFAALLGMVFSALLDAALRGIRDTPLGEAALHRAVQWCTSDGDDLVCLEEFERYHLELLYITRHRLGLLRDNFGVCDPPRLGVPPVPPLPRCLRRHLRRDPPGNAHRSPPSGTPCAVLPSVPAPPCGPPQLPPDLLCANQALFPMRIGSCRVSPGGRR